MIFVTVGTHEQPFDRLIKNIDHLKEIGIIKENVIVQSGYCTYKMKFCKQIDFLSYKEMRENIEKARIIVTHGGPASFIMAFQVKKIPIVVPRQKQFNEHVNNHQVDFVMKIEKRFNNIIPIYKIEDLKNALLDFVEISKHKSGNANSNNINFNIKLGEIVNKLMNEI